MAVQDRASIDMSKTLANTDEFSRQLRDIAANIQETTKSLQELSTKTNQKIKIKIEGIDENSQKMAELQDAIDKLFNGVRSPATLVRYFQSIENATIDVKKSWNELVKQVESGNIIPDELYSNAAATAVLRYSNAFEALGHDLAEISPEIKTFVQNMRGLSQFKDKNGFNYTVENMKKAFSGYEEVQKKARSLGGTAIFPGLTETKQEVAEVLSLAKTLGTEIPKAMGGGSGGGSGSGNGEGTGIDPDSIQRIINLLGEVGTSLKGIREAFGQVDDESGIGNLLSQIHDLNTGLQETVHKIDDVVAALANMDLNVSVNMSGGNPIDRSRQYGDTIRKQLLAQKTQIDEALKSIYQTEDVEQAYLNLVNKTGVMRSHGIDIMEFFSQVTSLSELPVKKLKQVLTEYISMAKEAAQIEHINLGNIVDADKIVEDANKILSGEKQIEEASQQLRSAFGGMSSTDASNLGQAMSNVSQQWSGVIKAVTEMNGIQAIMQQNNGIESQNVGAEVDSLDRLQTKLGLVKQAVEDKTTAFDVEAKTVDEAVSHEISNLNTLSDTLNDIANSLDKISKQSGFNLSKADLSALKKLGEQAGTAVRSGSKSSLSEMDKEFKAHCDQWAKEMIHTFDIKDKAAKQQVQTLANQMADAFIKNDYHTSVEQFYDAAMDKMYPIIEQSLQAAQRKPVRERRERTPDQQQFYDWIKSFAKNGSKMRISESTYRELMSLGEWKSRDGLFRKIVTPQGSGPTIESQWEEWMDKAAGFATAINSAAERLKLYDFDGKEVPQFQLLNEAIKMSRAGDTTEIAKLTEDDIWDILLSNANELSEEIKVLREKFHVSPLWNMEISAAGTSMPYHGPLGNEPGKEVKQVLSDDELNRFVQTYKKDFQMLASQKGWGDFSGITRTSNQGEALIQFLAETDEQTRTTTLSISDFKQAIEDLRASLSNLRTGDEKNILTDWVKKYGYLSVATKPLSKSQLKEVEQQQKLRHPREDVEKQLQSMLSSETLQKNLNIIGKARGWGELIKDAKAEMDADGNAILTFFKQVDGQVQSTTIAVRDFQKAFSSNELNVLVATGNPGSWVKDYASKATSEQLSPERQKINDTVAAYEKLTQTELEYKRLEDQVVNQHTQNANAISRYNELLAMRGDAYKNLEAETQKFVEHLNQEKVYTGEVTQAQQRYADAQKRTQEIMQQSQANKTYNQLDKSLTGVDKYLDKILNLGGVDTQYTDQAATLKQQLADLRTELNGLDTSQESASNAFQEKIEALNASAEELRKTIAEYRQVSPIQASQLNAQIEQWLSQNKKAVASFASDVEHLRGMMKQSYTEKEFSQINQAFDTFKIKAAQAGKLGNTVFGQWTQRLKNLGLHLASFVSFYRIIAMFRQGLNVIKEYDTAMTNLYKVSNDTRKELDAFGDTSYDIASGIGATNTAVIEAATEWSRLGKSISEASELAEASTIYANVGEIDATTATSDLVSVLNAFHKQASEALDVVDVLNEVGNSYAVSSAELGEILKKSSAALAVSGDSMEQIVAMGTAMNTTIQDAGTVGNTLKMVALRLRGK